jgi:hypothetical protein
MLTQRIGSLAANPVASERRVAAEFKRPTCDESDIGDKSPLRAHGDDGLGRISGIGCSPKRFCHAALDALQRRCPDYIEHCRWRQAIAVGARFLAQWGEQAAALGWTVRDLFGLAEIPESPSPNYQRLARYDQTGLIWLLHGRRVVALTKDTALIETANGTVSYRRYNKPALGPLGDSLDDMGSR